MIEDIEETLRRAEILIDGGTQKLLSGLAYLHYMREQLRKLQGSHQYTLTHHPATGVRAKQDQHKKWVMHLPQVKTHVSMEFGLWASCWFCDSTFQKTNFCSKCKLAICSLCGKCGCYLKSCCRKAVEKTLNAIFGQVKPIRILVRREQFSSTLLNLTEFMELP